MFSNGRNGAGFFMFFFFLPIRKGGSYWYETVVRPRCSMRGGASSGIGSSGGGDDLEVPL